MESYISHPDFGKSNFELFKTIKQETNNFQIDELLYLKKDLGNSLNGYLSSDNQTRTSSEGSIITDFSREINLIKNKLQIIDDELSRLEREKAKGNPKGGSGEKPNKRAVNVCVGNVEMNKPTFQKMLTKMNELFFDNSEIDQWESIIKNASPTQPIRVKKTTSIIDLRLFFDLLSENEIFESEYLTPLINLKAFFLDNSKQNKILEYYQLKQAKKYINKRKIKPKFSIDDFFSVIE